MQTRFPISPPAGYVTAVAVGVADADGSMALVGDGAPMPVSFSPGQKPEAFSGTVTQSSLAGPFVPLANAPMHLELSGEWTGSVELRRSVDGGATASGLTVAGMPWARFTSCANEIVWEECEQGAEFFLDIQLTSGTLGYRLSQ